MNRMQMDSVYRMRYLEQMRDDPDDPRHGTSTGYGYGCRCGRCKVARSMAYLKRKRKSAEAAEPGAKLKGDAE